MYPFNKYFNPLLLLIINCLIVFSNANFTFTPQMIPYCKEHLAIRGYSYDTFYRVDADELRHISNDSNIKFEMHLAILAASNGHILLSSVPHPTSFEPVYEIVVGGGGNKFTELRRNLRRNAKTSQTTLNVLSPIDFRAFSIKISIDDEFEFSREGDVLPILSYTDHNPFPIKYFSFASWTGVQAKFLYDCPVFGPNGTEIETSESTIVEPKLSNSEKLKRSLLKKHQVFLPPEPTVTIYLALEVTSVRYDAFESKLATSLSLVTSWTDERLTWESNKYNGTTSVLFNQGEIWKPTFYVFNSDNMEALNTKNPEPIYVAYTGKAGLHMESSFNTWCNDDATDTDSYNRWPHDEHDCFVVIGAWEAYERILIRQNSAVDTMLKFFSEIDDVIENEWDVSVKQGVVPHTSWNLALNLTDTETHQSDRFIIRMNLKRRPTTYNIVFYTPLFVLVTFILMSFWSEPLQLSRVWFYAGTTVVMVSGLCFMDYLMPCHTVPHILLLYNLGLVAVVTALAVQVLLMKPCVQRMCKSKFVQRIVTTPWLRLIFCLPPMKSCEIYETISEVLPSGDDEITVATGSSIIEEMQSDCTKISEVQEVADIVDKIMFVTYSVGFAIMLVI